MTVAKGNPAASNVGYFFAVLFFIVGGLMIISGYLGATILAIIGTIIIYASSHHAKNARIKKLSESNTLFGEGFTPSSIGKKCSNCGNVTGTGNSFCPHCGSKMT